MENVATIVRSNSALVADACAAALRAIDFLPFSSDQLNGRFQMLRVLRVPLILVFFSLLGCAAGSDFVRPATETLKLGTTTYSQVIQQMGEPRTSGEVLRNGATVKSISYSYVAAGSEPLEVGVTPARAQVYYFHNDTLVGQRFASSFKSDNSNFDETRTAALTKGKTTRAEVIQLFGRPSAVLIPPMVKEGSGEALGYTYQTARKVPFTGFKFYRKNLTITFDGKDQVLDIEYSSSGDK